MAEVGGGINNFGEHYTLQTTSGKVSFSPLALLLPEPTGKDNPGSIPGPA